MLSSQERAAGEALRAAIRWARPLRVEGFDFTDANRRSFQHGLAFLDGAAMMAAGNLDHMELWPRFCEARRAMREWAAREGVSL